MQPPRQHAAPRRDHNAGMNITTLRHHFRHIEPGFFRKFFALGWPISMQLLLASSLALVDVLMVSSLGATSVASVGLAGKFFFVVILMASGVASGAATLAAQYAGQDDAAGVRRVLSIALLAGWLAAMPFTLATWLAPDTVMGWFSNDPELVRIGARFLQVTAPFHLLMATVAVVSAVLRVYDKAVLPMAVGFMAVGCNTVLNYFLIYGSHGAPALGVEGAAWATLTAKALECLVLLGLVYFTRSPIRLAWAEFCSSFTALEVRRFLRQSLPLVMNEMVWAGGVFAISVIYGRMGTAQLAATTLVGPIEAVSIDIFIGFTQAASILIATALGAGEFAKARQRAVVLAATITGVTFVYGCVLLALKGEIFMLFGSVDAAVLAMARDLVVVLAFTLWLRLYNVVACVSILRSGGEVRYTLWVDLLVTWGVMLPATAWAGLVMGWPLTWVFAIALCTESLFKAPAYTFRIFQRTWLRTLV
jgi:putative MATE family efflux protein